MSKKHGRIKLTETTIRVLLLTLGSAISTIIMAFSIMALYYARLTPPDATMVSVYMFLIFIVLGLSRFVTYLRDRTRTNFIRFAFLFVLNISLGVIAYFGKDNSYCYSACGGIFCISIIISRIFKIIQKPTARSIVLNALIITLFALLALGLFVPYGPAEMFAPIMIVCFIVIIASLIEVLANAFLQLKLKTLLKIIIRTFALEVLLGLLTMVVASAIVFAYFEDSITTFGDGLWYSFAVVTTIGFGDFAAKTLIGRIVTVLLGMYGIVVVAVITSIIVNFYNETSGKQDTEEMKQIHKEDVEKKKKK